MENGSDIICRMCILYFVFLHNSFHVHSTFISCSFHVHFMFIPFSCRFHSVAIPSLFHILVPFPFHAQSVLGPCSFHFRFFCGPSPATHVGSPRGRTCVPAVIPIRTFSTFLKQPAASPTSKKLLRAGKKTRFRNTISQNVLRIRYWKFQFFGLIKTVWCWLSLQQKWSLTAIYGRKVYQSFLPIKWLLAATFGVRIISPIMWW